MRSGDVFVLEEHRLIDVNNHYRLEVTTTKITLARVWGGTRTVIGSLTNMTFTPGLVYNIGIMARVRTITAIINATTVISVVEPATYASYGAGGMYIGAASAAVFDDFYVESDWCVRGGGGVSACVLGW